MKRKINKIFSVFVLCCIHSTWASEAQQLFELRCSSCHSHGVDFLRFPESRLREALTPGAIRQHRFSLTENEIAGLIEYLKTK